MNKQELQKKYQEIVLKTNGGNEDYVVALCQIANAINELDEPKQDNKWQKLKEIIKNLYVKAEPGGIEHCVTTYIYKKMQELEAEDVED